MTNSSSTKSQFLTLVTVFFFWGFLAASNGVFIPFCKSHFELTQLQSQLIDWAFYFAYFFGSLGLYLIDKIVGIDILNKIGYKMGIIYGLFFSAFGALLMIAAVNSGSYTFILASFFVIALGFSLQQTCAQPFAISLGEPKSGANRLSFAGGVNSFGTTVGPIIVGYFLFGGPGGDASRVEITSVNTMYMILAGLFVAVALFFMFSNLPKITHDEHIEPGLGALKYPQLVLGMVGIFIYVGVEVTIQSNMGALLKLPEFGGYEESQIAHFISLYWASLMIGRWTGAISVFNFSSSTNKILTVFIPFIAFAVALGANYLGGHPISDLYPYAFCIVLFIVCYFIGEDKPAKTLLILALFGVVAMLIGLFAKGAVAKFAFISGGLACSIMWPCIFALATAGLGKYTSQGSMFLIMMILGGAIIPLVQGAIADSSIGIHQSYWIAVVCFAYLAFFAVRVKGILKAQGIDYEQEAVAAAH
ncbi:MFS transporter [Solitalea lacus]|uniref:MFS transporter n=1 Tax=Solitalea lacus TaxID=2911172 RepID=UPI001EDAB690|nr:MFS transporter [Solitalea lacus]UKJ06299.1 MFS transporter [Solitalea lacus]